MKTKICSGRCESGASLENVLKCKDRESTYSTYHLSLVTGEIDLDDQASAVIREPI